MSEYYELDSGLLIPEGEAVRRKLAGTRPKCVDLFCGCGGMSLGMIQAGWQVMAGIDNEVDACQTYLSNLGTYPCQMIFVEDADRRRMEKSLTKKYSRHDRRQLELPVTAGSGWISSQRNPPPGVGTFFLGDIRKISGQQILNAIGVDYGELDAVVGSPPCQGFSHAGKRNVMDPRNSLMFEFARLVCEMQPKTMVLENVPGIVSMVTEDGIPIVDAFTRILEDGNFAGIDAVRNALKAQLGVTILRGKKPKPKAKARRREKRKAA